MPHMKQATVKAKSGLVASTPAAATGNLRANSMESVIDGLQQLRREALAVGLPKVTACLDYAYYEALGALRESRNKPKVDGKALL